MSWPTAQALIFQSTDNQSVLDDPANEDWLAVIKQIRGEDWEITERRYYVALRHFRKQQQRPSLPGLIEVEAEGKQQALQGMLEVIEQRKGERQKASGEAEAEEVLFDARPDPTDESLPEVLRDFSKLPQSLSAILAGPGRPPCDGLCLLRAFVAASVMGTDGGPTEVFRLLHSNPELARICGFQGRDTKKGENELTSRRLPSQATCEEFNEVMTRYGLWSHDKLEQVQRNHVSGALIREDTVSFDTTHVQANSHCGNVVPPDKDGNKDKKAKHRKVPRMQKRCSCGEECWESCEHPWTPTDQGAAVVVKGPTSIYWAHKFSVVAYGASAIPLDIRVCHYAAVSDGKTLVPHLELLERDLPMVVDHLRYVLADDAYRGNSDAVRQFGQQALLTLPVHPRKVKAEVAEAFRGINRFTPIGVPICEDGHRFVLLGRDITEERYIWAAPFDDQNQPVCLSCPLANACVEYGQRRQFRIDRHALPQINWDHPQHFTRHRARYGKRTGVERAIKRIKVDLNGQHLTHRDVHRVQAYLDRKLLTLHLLLAASVAK